MVNLTERYNSADNIPRRIAFPAFGQVRIKKKQVHHFGFFLKIGNFTVKIGETFDTRKTYSFCGFSQENGESFSPT